MTNYIPKLMINNYTLAPSMYVLFKANVHFKPVMCIHFLVNCLAKTNA